jgi:hypothetical protein
MMLVLVFDLHFDLSTGYELVTGNGAGVVGLAMAVLLVSLHFIIASL